MIVPHEPYILENARKNRKEMTPEEKHLWYDFLKKAPVKINKQKPFGPYIVDFYIDTAKLIIELDGAQHYEEQAEKYDQNRTRYLEAQGNKVIRYTNIDIHHNFDAICRDIQNLTEQRSGIKWDDLWKQKETK